MAIYRPSAIVGAISGNVGGVCFVVTKAGLVARKRNVRTRNTSKRRFEVNAGFQKLRNAWRSLSEIQQTSWRQAALTFPHTNRLGLATRLTGFALFIKVNALGFSPPNFGPFPIVHDPPILTNRPPFRIVAFDVTSGGPKTFTLEDEVPIPPATLDTLIVSAARTYSTSVLRSWHSYKSLQFNIAAAGPMTLTDWDSIIGDPQPNEQCWISVIQWTPGHIKQNPYTASTLAT